jgi:EpsI family protein
MPGAGWNFLDTQEVTLQATGNKPLTIHALRAILVNGEERLLTYYWYQSRGRFETSEYWQKINLVTDAIRYNRTDGSLVRVLAPIPKGDFEDVDALLRDFIIQFTPTLYYDYFPKPVGGAAAS